MMSLRYWFWRRPCRSRRMRWSGSVKAVLAWLDRRRTDQMLSTGGEVGCTGRQVVGGEPVLCVDGVPHAAVFVDVEDAPVVRQAAGGVVVVVGGWMPVELSCDVAFEAADDLASGHAFGGASLQVGPGAFVPAYSGLDDAVEGGVCLTVAAAVQSPSPGFAGRVPRRW